MGATILSVAVAGGRHGLFKASGIKLAEQAACACLKRAERRASEIDLLINAGIYHDNNLGEPALAALIQGDIGANPHVSERDRHGTFSFDVQNGGAGAITAIHLLDGFLDSAIELGLVVASDAAPGSPVEPKFPFPSVGAAALLGRGRQRDQGFVAFQFDDYCEFEGLFEAQIAWHEGRLARGKNVLEFRSKPAFAMRAVECAVESTRRFLVKHDLSVDGIDLIVPSQSPAGFPDALALGLEIPAQRIARVSEELSGAHTAGPLAAVAAAQHEGRWSDSKTILFVTVGAGINCALALYRNDS